MITQIISLLPVIYVVVTAIPLIVIDLKEQRLPNKIVAPLILLTLASWLTLAIWQGKWAELGLAFALAFGVFILGLCLNFIDYVGMGDVKYATALTLIVGWFSAMAGLMFPATLFLLVIVGIGFLLLLDNLGVIVINRYKTVPLGPYILLSFAINMAYALLR
jgi:leader peptidase (prepilin peptidase)/N-methyltransferase